MSSVAASLFQVNTRSKFFKSIGASIEYEVPASPSAIVTAVPEYALASPYTGTSGTTYRDMGKRVVLVDADGHLAVYAQVRKCAGQEDPTIDSVLVLVWHRELPTAVTVVSI
jgi:hypothetical protein